MRVAGFGFVLIPVCVFSYLKIKARETNFLCEFCCNLIAQQLFYGWENAGVKGGANCGLLIGIKGKRKLPRKNT